MLILKTNVLMRTFKLIDVIYCILCVNDRQTVKARSQEYLRVDELTFSTFSFVAAFCYI